MGIEQGLFEVLQIGLVHGKLAQERPVGHASLPLEHRDRRIEDLLEGHVSPSLWRMASRGSCGP